MGRVVHAAAASVTASEVRLDNGSSVAYDYLVLASGSTWTDPVNSGTEAALVDRKLHQQVKASGTMTQIRTGTVTMLIMKTMLNTEQYVLNIIAPVLGVYGPRLIPSHQDCLF